MMLEEVEQINEYGGNYKVIYLKERIESALNTLNTIPKEILGRQTNTDYYKLLKNLKKII